MTRTAIIPARKIDIEGATDTHCRNERACCPQSQHANHTGWYCLAGFKPGREHAERDPKCIKNETVATDRMANLKSAADQCLTTHAAIDAATCEAELPPHLR